tara:strand:+ start:2524 stop:3123 length:600 start_codon:yes stop_codon:yes gene_type:complete
MRLRSSSRKKIRCIWIDLETTGFNIFHDNIIEIAALDDELNEFSHLISSTKKIPKKVVEITHITNEMLVDKPPITEIMPKLIEFITNSPEKSVYLIGHNIYGFDMPFLLAQCKKYNMVFPKNIKVIDTMRMSQYILPTEYSHSLGYLCRLFNVDNVNAHRALSDVYATKIIYNNLCMIIRGTHPQAKEREILKLTKHTV